MGYAPRKLAHLERIVLPPLLQNESLFAHRAGISLASDCEISAGEPVAAGSLGLSSDS